MRLEINRSQRGSMQGSMRGSQGSIRRMFSTQAADEADQALRQAEQAMVRAREESPDN